MLYGHAQINGRGRNPPSTEDRILIRKLTSTCDLFAVFDGHSGTGAANLTVKLLPDRLITALEAAGAGAANPATLRSILEAAFLEHDKELARELLVKKSLRGQADSGCTATVALVTPTHIAVAYLGDSPGILLNPVNGTIDREIGKHEPSLAAETARITAAGGTVEIDEHGTPRVDGSLMVSRAFGDFSLKFNLFAPPPFEADWTRFKVTAHPDVVVWPRPDYGVLALMSDGLVETPMGTAKPLLQVARDIYLALQATQNNLPYTARMVVDRHVAADVGSDRHRYDGDDLSLVVVDVGTRGSVAPTGPQTGAGVATVSLPVQKPKTRKARAGRRNRTGKKSRLIKILQM